MKRSTFIASLLGFVGVGKAQQWKEPHCVKSVDPTPLSRETHLVQCLEYSTGKALNNQCPTCGTMAPSYQRPQSGRGSIWSERVTRCKRCNAAFWQDAER